MGFKKGVQTKRNSMIESGTFADNINSDVVRILALMCSAVSVDAIKEIYQAYNYYLGDVNKDIPALGKQGVLQDERGNRPENYVQYYGYYKVIVNPLCFCQILQGIPDEKLEEYKSIIKRVIDKRYSSTYDKTKKENIIAAHTLALAICDCLHNRPLDATSQATCGKAFAKSPTLYYSNDNFYPHLILPYLLEETSVLPLLASLPANIKGELRKDICGHIANTASKPDISLYRIFFFDENDKPYHEGEATLYVLHAELLKQGNVEVLMQKYKDCPQVYFFLSALKDLHEGNTSGMIHAIKTFVQQYGEDILVYPIFQFFAAAALLLDKTDAANKYASKLHKARALKNKAELLHIMLEYKLTGDISPTTLIAFNDCHFCSYASNLFFSLFLKHYQLLPGEKQRANLAKEHEKLMLASDKKYLALLFAAEDESHEKLYNELQEQTGMSTFFPFQQKREEWELRIDRLIELTAPPKAKSNKPVEKEQTESSARVAYLMCVPRKSVQPILQKSKDGKTWTKGRAISLKTFSDKKTEGMTQEDIAISGFVQSYYSYYGGMQYYLDGNEVVNALVGHPLVFTNDDEHRLKIDITREPLQLFAKADKTDRYTIETNINVDEVDKGYYVDTSNQTSLRVVPVPSAERELLLQIQKMGSLPKKAKDKLALLLNQLSGRMTVMSDLIADENIERIEASAVITVQLVPVEENIRISLFAKPFATVPPYLTPAEGIETVSGKLDGKPVRAIRDLAAEQRNLEAVEQVLSPFVSDYVGDNIWMLTVAQTLDLLNSLNRIKEAACVEWPEGVRLKVTRPQIMPDGVHISVHKLGDWFELEGEVKIDDNTQLAIADLLRLLRESKGRFIRLNEQEHIALSEHLASQLRRIAQLTDGTGKQLKVSPFSAPLIDELEQAGVDIQADNAYRSLLKNISEADTMTVKIPRGIQADLRDYQKDGFRWLSRLAHWGAGACLADDMGLGKTLQSIALMYSRRSLGPSLVIAPTSVLLNWQDEIHRFAPSLCTLILNQGTGSREEIVKSAKFSDIVIASYGLLVTEQELMTSRQWNTLVLDEAHTIKNRETKMSKAAMTLSAANRVALTGTPLQNRLSEIWTIFQFLNPGLLGSFQQFSDKFITPIEKNNDRDRQRLLKRLVAPFILRRTKTDVLSELPEKTEITVKVNLSDEERTLYEQLRQEALAAVESGEKNAIQALADITRLRQAACHPQLIDPRLKLDSSKSATFMQLVHNLHSNHHRALVFSQFTSHLALVRQQLDSEGIAYLYLDGATPAKQRAALVEQFQTGDMPLFLISLKAGGLGLNLTAADYVIHLDPWWNPAIEDQASDRSYRIGQQKPVTVYRLIAANTIEEKILRLHSHKKSLADALLEGADLSARLTKEEILNLLGERL